MGKITINGKEYLYNPYHNALTLARIQVQIAQDRSFLKVFRVNMTDDFISSMKDIVNPKIRNEQNTIWNVYGETGTGKTMSVMSLVKEITPDTFTYKNVVFFNQQVLDKAKEIGRDTFIIRDETVGMYGIGSNRIETDLDILAETCRKAGVNLAFLSGEEKHIGVAKYILMTVDIDYVNRITRLALKDPVTNSYMGAVYVKVLPVDDYDWVEYNKAKDEFIESVKKGKRTAGKTDYRSMAKEMAKKIDINNFRSKKQRLAYLQTELTNLTRGEIEIISTFMEIVLENGEDAIDDKPEEKEYES